MSERELAEWMEKLVRDNRRLKRTGVGLFVVLVALTTVYATRPVPDVIKAPEFDVVDNKGRVAVKLFEHSPLEFELNAGIEIFDTYDIWQRASAIHFRPDWVVRNSVS